MANTFKIRNFIKAKSEKRLRLLMYQKQIQLGMQALEFDIVSHNGYLLAFYYESLNNDNLKDIIDDTTENNRR